MRKWINLVEGQNLQLQIANGYDEFYSLAKDHISDFEEDDRDLSQKAYHAIVEQITRDLTNRPLYRGMTIRQIDLENAKHLGVYYSDLKGHADVFSRGGDIYDDRFTDLEFNEGKEGIVIEIEPVSLETINIPVTAAMNLYGGEGEIRLFENESVRIKSITDGMGRGVWSHLWGADYLT